MILEIQRILVFCIMIINGLMMIVDLIPLEYVKTKDNFEEELN